MRAAQLGVLILGVSVWWAGCSVEDGDDDDGGSGEAGESGSSGTAGKGGSSGKGGSAGYSGKGGSAGYSGKGGSGEGGSGAVGSETGGSSGTAGEAPTDGGEGGWDSGSGGTGAVGGEDSGGSWNNPGGQPAIGGEGGVPPKNEAGAGGEGDVSPVASCDPDEGEGGAGPAGTPYPDCEPLDSEDACEVCVQQNCCEESKGCWATEPFNTCGWGGPESSGEIGCYQQCIQEWVGENDACGTTAHNACVEECLTEACEEISDATWNLAVCMNDNCADECYGAACTY